MNWTLIFATIIAIFMVSFTIRTIRTTLKECMDKYIAMKHNKNSSTISKFVEKLLLLILFVTIFLFILMLTGYVTVDGWLTILK